MTKLGGRAERHRALRTGYRHPSRATCLPKSVLTTTRLLHRCRALARHIWTAECNRRLAMQQTLNRYDADGSGELSDAEMCALLGYVLHLCLRRAT